MLRLYSAIDTVERAWHVVWNPGLQYMSLVTMHDVHGLRFHVQKVGMIISVGRDVMSVKWGRIYTSP